MRKLIIISLIFLCGCNPMAIMCFDDPDCPKQYRYCPIEKKQVHVSRNSESTVCDKVTWSCPELLMPRQCTWCTTTFTDDQGHVWSPKKFKEVVQ